MSRRKRLTLNDWARIPTVNVVDQPRETLKSFTAKEDARRTKELEAPLRKVQNDMNSALRENAANVAAFYSRPIEKLLNSSTSSAPIDFGLGSFPERTEEQSDDEVRFVLTQFCEATTAQVDLNESGWARFLRNAKQQSSLQKFAITLEFLHACLVRLGELGCFNAGEIVKGEIPKRQSQPQSQPEAEAKSSKVINYLLESTPTESHVWRKVTAQGFSAEFSKWVVAWIESLKANFDYDFDVDKLGVKAAGLIDRMNWSPFSYSTWDKVRVAFVRTGDFPNYMLTADERLCELIDASPSLNDYATRRDFQRRSQELMPHK
jgi:hypothetical protein